MKVMKSQRSQLVRRFFYHKQFNCLMKQFFLVHIKIIKTSFLTISLGCTGHPKKLCLTLTIYFEEVTIKMLEILGSPVFPGMYNPFDTLLICFHDLINKWQSVIF